jgi:hypothetical protein
MNGIRLERGERIAPMAAIQLADVRGVAGAIPTR